MPFGYNALVARGGRLIVEIYRSQGVVLNLMVPTGVERIEAGLNKLPHRQQQPISARST